MKRGYVYIMASGRNGTIYIGSTAELIQRTCQHRDGLADSFTRKHGCKLLVWYEAFDDLQEARLRELQMKKMEAAVETQHHRADEPRLGRPLSDALLKAPVEPAWAPAFAGAQ